MKFIFLSISILIFTISAEAQNKKKKVKVKHKTCSDISELAPHFKKCSPVKCGDREIVGMIDGKCKYTEAINVESSGIKMKMTLNCLYPESYLPALADMYGSWSNKKEENVVNKHVNATRKERNSKIKKMKTYKIDGEETENPMTLATEKGHCKYGS